MGKMKEICMEIIEANEGIPEGMTIADVARMKELEMYNWEEYEQQQEKNRVQSLKSENPKEAKKIEQISKKFSAKYGGAREEKESEQ
jgi:hypothetical protein